MKRKYTTSNNTSSGMSMLGVLQIIFIVLKVLNLVAWSWWTVLIPLWIDLGLIVIAIVYLLICYWCER